MSGTLWRGLWVALACGAGASGETLDEGLDRLAKAAAETRDLSIQYTVHGALPASRAGKAAARPATIAGTGEFLMLRDGAKCLLRLATSVAIERPGPDQKAPPAKIQRSTLAVNDGQTLWHEETKVPGKAPQVQKQRVPARGGLRLRGSLGAIDSPFSKTGLKVESEELGQYIDIKFAGRGNVAGRPSTTLEFGVKAERLKAWSEARRARDTARSVVEMDDATGAALAVKDFSATGELLRNLSATEVKANAGLDQKLFTYAPPEGAEVTDLNPPPKPPESPGTPPKAP